MSKRFGELFHHLLVFVFIEIIFVFLVFQELPSLHLASLVGVVHLIYFLIVLLAGRMRINHCTSVICKGFCTALPLVYHLFAHIYIVLQTLSQYNIHHQEIIRLIVNTGFFTVMIFFGEYLLHCTKHCKTHHQRYHQQCHDKNCEEMH